LSTSCFSQAYSESTFAAISLKVSEISLQSLPMKTSVISKVTDFFNIITANIILCLILKHSVSCTFICVREQKARTTYDNILRLVDDPDIREPIKFLRQREIVHFQRFGEPVETGLNDKNEYKKRAKP